MGVDVCHQKLTRRLNTCRECKCFRRRTKLVTSWLPMTENHICKCSEKRYCCSDRFMGPIVARLQYGLGEKWLGKNHGFSLINTLCNFSYASLHLYMMYRHHFPKLLTLNNLPLSFGFTLDMISSVSVSAVFGFISWRLHSLLRVDLFFFWRWAGYY